MTPLLHRISQRLLPSNRRSTSPDTQRHDRRRRQRGFALGQALITTAVLGGVSAVGTDWISQQRQTAALAAQNAVYARINNGVGLYMTLYYPKLIDRSTYPDNCATVNYAAPASAVKGCSFKASYTDAAGASQERVINNILQPTLPDLQALGLVDPLIPAGPVLPVNATVSTGVAAGSAPAARENIYGILIKRVPAGTDVNLESLVFNVQPYMLVNGDISMLLRLSNGAGATSGLPDRDARTSSINPDFDLKGYAGAWSATNPIQQTLAGATRGMPGIMAWRNSFAANALMELVRRDGTLKPTADWDFNNHSITNLNQVQAKGVKTDTLTATTLTTDTLTANGAAKLNGTLDVKGQLTALGGLIVQGATDIQQLAVNGTATFQQAVTMKKTLTVDGELTANGGVRTASVNVENGPQLSRAGARLLANGGLVTEGSECPQNLSLAQDGNGRLMMCTTGKWQTATNNVYGLTLVTVGDSCTPEGSAAYLSNGLMAICRSGKWQAASLGTQTAGQACSTKGMMAAEITAHGVSNLLVCQAGSGGSLAWSTSIYARPKAELATAGASCDVDQINAVARNSKGNDAGILMCTSDGSGGATWTVPFKKYTEDFIDKNEYLAVDFAWKDWYHGGLNSFYWGQVIMGPITLKHWKNGTVVQTWNTAYPTSTLGPDNGLYVRWGNAGGDYPDENYSYARFTFDTPMDPQEWTAPEFRMPSFTCSDCYVGDDLPAGTGAGPNRRETSFRPSEFSFAFYNKYGSNNGTIHYYQLVMFRKVHRVYLMAE